MKSIWKGAINFGMVNIPVRLYPATKDSHVSLQLVDKNDFGKIRYHRVNEKTGKEVSSENIAKAYNLNGDLIILSDADFQNAEPEKTNVISVNHFIDEKEINSIYFENSYYLEPERHGEKAYALLREALRKSGKVGVSQFVLRSSEALAVIKPLGNVLVLSRIRFAQEIRNPDELALPTKSAVKQNELKMAQMLIDQFTGPFDINNYQDEYSDALLKRIKDKASGKYPKVRKIKLEATENLIEKLKASLAKNKAS